MPALRRTSLALPAPILSALLPAAIIFSALLIEPAMSQMREPAREIPGACRPTLAAFVTDLREADRRLRPTRNRPDAAGLQSSILAETVARPTSSASLSALLACLAERR